MAYMIAMKLGFPDLVSKIISDMVKNQINIEKKIEAGFNKHLQLQDRICIDIFVIELARERHNKNTKKRYMRMPHLNFKEDTIIKPSKFNKYMVAICRDVSRDAIDKWYVDSCFGMKALRIVNHDVVML